MECIGNKLLLKHLVRRLESLDFTFPMEGGIESLLTGMDNGKFSLLHMDCAKKVFSLYSYSYDSIRFMEAKLRSPNYDILKIDSLEDLSDCIEEIKLRVEFLTR